MSWYDSDFRRSKAISVISPAGGGTHDFDVEIPTDWDEFWDLIDTDGEELRITRADGSTLCAYDIDDGAGGAFDKTGRAGRIRVDGEAFVGATGECALFWLFFDPSSTQGDASVAVTITSALTGYIEQALPSTHVHAFQPAPAGSTKPASRITKGEDDDVFVWLEITALLERRAERAANHLEYEEPIAATYDVLDDVGASEATMVEPDDLRWVSTVEGNTRRLFLRCRVKAGTDGDTFTLFAIAATVVPVAALAVHRYVTARVGVRVVDALET